MRYYMPRLAQKLDTQGVLELAAKYAVRINIVEGLNRYAVDRIPTGSFLRAVLENDLKEAVARADGFNAPVISHIVTLCYNELPNAAWGSPSRVLDWLTRKGEAAKPVAADGLGKGSGVEPDEASWKAEHLNGFDPPTKPD
jgi:hypothetical protein